MAATPQQVKAWVRPAGPPQQDVGAALAALSGEDLLRLRAIARLRARSLPPGGLTWSDLLHEAVLRALAGDRAQPQQIFLRQRGQRRAHVPARRRGRPAPILNLL